MPALPTATVDGWRDPATLSAAAAYLTQALASGWPEAAELAETSPLAALGLIPELKVVSDANVTTSECRIDGTYDPATATIRYRRYGNARDHFTLLHELAHHLLAYDEDWAYEKKPLLGDHGDSVEEAICNTFAAHTLIPIDATDAAFQHGVTAAALRELAANTHASAHAVLYRALSEPGHRLAMLCDAEGRVRFAQTTGEPYSPGHKTTQPAVADLVTRALTSPDRTAHQTGGRGIVYSSGNANPHGKIDVALDGGYVYVVAVPVVRDIRADSYESDPSEWHVTCVKGCGETFAPARSSGRCPTCYELVCPRCHGCECRKDSYCTKCNGVLPTAFVSAGRTLCDWCE